MNQLLGKKGGSLNEMNIKQYSRIGALDLSHKSNRKSNQIAYVMFTHFFLILFNFSTSILVF
jgi:hypothetical protein